MFEKLMQTIKSVFTTEPTTVTTPIVTPARTKTVVIEAPELAIAPIKYDKTPLSTFQVAAGYAALMKYREDKLLGKRNGATLESTFEELNRRLGTNKSTSNWARILKEYENTVFTHTAGV
jgi:hypothetical protein